MKKFNTYRIRISLLVSSIHPRHYLRLYACKFFFSFPPPPPPPPPPHNSHIHHQHIPRHSHIHHQHIPRHSHRHRLHHLHCILNLPLLGTDQVFPYSGGLGVGLEHLIHYRLQR